MRETTPDLTRISKYISLILRHKPEVIRTQLDAHGWADVNALLAGISRKYPINRDILEEIVGNILDEYDVDEQYIVRGEGDALIMSGMTPLDEAQEELGIEPLAFKNANECATAVMGGKADAAILDKVPAQTLAMANPDALETVEQLLTEEEMAMGVAKGNEDLREAVNSVLQKAMDDGTVESLTDKHLKICAEG